MQGRRNACSFSGVSEIEESGRINGGLQTLNLSLPLQFNWDMLQLFLAFSFKISSVCLCTALSRICWPGQGLNTLRCFFSSRSLLPYYYSPPLHTHLLHLSKQIGALICLFFRSFRVIPHGRFALMGGLLSWEVCPEGVIAGVRSLPMHQQKCICASPGKSYQLGSRASLFLW